MKKKIILILSLLVILVVLGVVFKNPKVTDEGQYGQEELVLNNSFETKSVSLSDPYVIFDIKYPYFKNASDDFNLKAEELLKYQMTEHAKISQENWQARFETQAEGDNIPNVPATSDDKFSFVSDFTIVQSNSSYISYVLRYGGFSGGAHGYEIKISFAYDVKNQKIIELRDLFPDNPEYLAYLSSVSREYLNGQFATVSEEDRVGSSEEAIQEYINNVTSIIKDGTEPAEENFSVFTFTPNKIKIYFAQYQVGPYSIGMPEIEIDR